MSDRLRLGGGLPGTVSWVYFEDDGTLVVEFYDHSSEAEQWFGNDVAMIIKVAASERARVVEGLFGTGASPRRTREVAILKALCTRFASYFQVRVWFDELGIAYRKEFDSWA